MNDPMWLLVKAGVRYWEDAKINGIEDVTGKMIPHRDGEYWNPIIHVLHGFVLGWPRIEAEIHYKVCDDGEYWLLDSRFYTIAKRKGFVPEPFLCHGKRGYGDYIILNITNDGFIKNWQKPEIVEFEWDWYDEKKFS